MCDIIKKAYFSVFDKRGGIARYFPEKKKQQPGIFGLIDLANSGEKT